MMQFIGVENYSSNANKGQRRSSQNLFEKLERWFEKFVSFLILSSLFVAISGLSVICFSFLFFEIPPKPDMLLAFFLVTYSIYSLNKLTDKEEDSVNVPERADFIKNRENILIFLTIVTYGIALMLGLLESILAIPVLLIPLASGMVYSVKIFSGIRLKDVFAVKNLIVSFTWASEAAFLPAICLQKTLTPILLIFNFVFIKGIINTVLFDMRDVKGDRKSGTKTIPVVFGVPKTKALLLAIHSSLIVWLGVSLYLGFFIRYLPLLIFTIIYGYFYIFHFCSGKGTDTGGFSFDLIVEGEWILLALLALIFSSFV
ncbi:MAG: UbiA family prenyltransferase [Halobacteriota archaeon]|nr:UbiA family prenyltransferase [Halobacteriota archaeon]